MGWLVLLPSLPRVCLVLAVSVGVCMIIIIIIIISWHLLVLVWGFPGFSVFFTSR